MATIRIISHLSGLALICSVACLIAGCVQSAATEQTPSHRPASGDATSTATSDPAESSAATDAIPAAEPAVSSEPPTTPPTHAAAPSTPAAAPQAKAAPADRTPTKPGDAEKITFDDLNIGMQANIVFRDFMVTDRVHDLEGKRVSIVGYMHPPETQRRHQKIHPAEKHAVQIRPRRPSRPPDRRQPPRHHSTVFTPSPLKVEGTLKLFPFQGPDGNTWSIYRLEDAVIR